MTSSIQEQGLFEALDTIYEGKSLDFTQSKDLFNRVLQGQLSDIELTALLLSLKLKTESIEEISGAASAMIENAADFARPSYPFSDIVGTGGDGHNTINISSAAAVVAASCGVKVAKHGNRSVSSKSGSSDLFAAFGMKLDMTPSTALACLDQANLCFLAAPYYHSGMKYVMPVRTALKTRTLFNILGPLANPAKPTHSMLGVYTPALLDIYAQTLITLGHQNALVVHGAGLDELALHGVSDVIEITAASDDKGQEQGAVAKRTQLSAKDFGLSEFPLSSIEGGDPQQNRELIANVFVGKGKPAHTSAIAMNAAALIKLNKMAPDYKQACDMAMASIEAGKPMQSIEHAAKVSQQNTHNQPTSDAR